MQVKIFASHQASSGVRPMWPLSMSPDECQELNKAALLAASCKSKSRPTKAALHALKRGFLRPSLSQMKLHTIACRRQLQANTASDMAGSPTAVDAYSGNWRQAAFAQFGGSAVQSVDGTPGNAPGPGELQQPQPAALASSPLHA